jgi:hypothetical protein
MRDDDMRARIVDALEAMLEHTSHTLGTTVRRPTRTTLLLKLPTDHGPRFFEVRVTEKE